MGSFNTCIQLPRPPHSINYSIHQESCFPVSWAFCNGRVRPPCWPCSLSQTSQHLHAPHRVVTYNTRSDFLDFVLTSPGKDLVTLATFFFSHEDSKHQHRPLATLVGRGSRWVSQRNDVCTSSFLELVPEKSTHDSECWAGVVVAGGDGDLLKAPGGPVLPVLRANWPLVALGLSRLRTFSGMHSSGDPIISVSSSKEPGFPLHSVAASCCLNRGRIMKFIICDLMLAALASLPLCRGRRVI